MLEGQLRSSRLIRSDIIPLIATTCVLLVIVLSLYVLPIIVPTAIGTGYIVLTLIVTALSVFIWYNQSISPKSVLLLSLLYCILLAPLMPYTSNDAHRYLWDGAVFLSGKDPYLTAPNDPAVSDLRAIWSTPEEHADYPTLYPPGGLILFALSALAGPSNAIWVWKAITTLTLGLSLVLGYQLLEMRQSLKTFALFALSPVILFEAQLGAHLDIICVLGVVGSLWCLQKEKVILAGVIIGLAATVKFLPAVLVGPLLFYLKPHVAFKLFITSALAWLCVYALMFGLGYKPLGLLPTFFEKWRGGAPIYPTLERLKEFASISTPSFLICLLVLACFGFTISGWLAKRGRIETAMMAALAVPLLLSPVLFPWYLMSLVIFLALKPSFMLLIALTLAPLSYIVLNKWLSENIWQQEAWPAQALLIGIIIGLALDFAVRKKPQRHTENI